MDGIIWRKIKSMFTYLVNNQDCGVLLDHLYEEDVLNQEEFSRVRAEKITQDKNRKLFEILAMKSEDCHLKYLECLTKSGQESLSEKIRTVKLSDLRKSGGQEFAEDTEAARRLAKSSVILKERLSNTLRTLFCLGENSFKCDIYPYLVCNSPGSLISLNDHPKNFEFLRAVPWKAIFEFETSDGAKENSLYDFMDDKLEMVMTVCHVDDFKLPNHSSSLLEEKIKNSKHPVWVFANGYILGGKEVLNLMEWKRRYVQGFRGALQFFGKETPKERCLIVFLLLEENYSIMLQAAEEVLLALNCPEKNWIVLAETEAICREWKTEFLKRGIVDEKQLENKCITGMPWEHVNETILQLFEGNKAGLCRLPSSTGTPVSVPHKLKIFLADLDILGYDECANTDVATDKQRSGELEQIKSDNEQEFYQGSQVSWWNFYFRTHVLERDIVEKLCVRVEQLLRGDDIEEDQLVCRINFCHQPAAGGTTVVKHVLWKLKKRYRCVKISHITDQTWEQIFKLRSYSDPCPKPVLLLLDNVGDEQVSDLIKKLVCEAKKLNIDRSSTVVFVLMVCSRKVNIKASGDPNTFVLPSKLSDGELLWLAEKHKKLLRKGVNPNNFISFNILKENFNPAYMKRSVQELTKNIVLPQERKLLKYIALINTFDIYVQSLPVASFDCIMAFKWEISISEPLRILLNETFEVGYGQQKTVRIINSALSRYVFDSLRQTPDENIELEGNIMLELLNSSIFGSTENVVEQLLKVIRSLMKARRKQIEGGAYYATKFSPLVEAIVHDKKQDIPLAAQVLKRVFNLSDDYFVAQQIARLYIYSKNWQEAKEYGELITSSRPENSFLWDTLAQVFKGQLLEKYHECLERRRTSSALVPASHAPMVLQIGFCAIDVFRKEQEVSENETTFAFGQNNNAGYLGEIETVVRLLDYMSSVEGLEQVTKLRMLLNDDSYVPEGLDCWGPEIIDRVKTLVANVFKTLSRLDDESLQVKFEYRDESRKKTSRNLEENLLHHRECINGYICEGVQEVPVNYNDRQKAGFYRRGIHSLRGDTLRGLFDIRNSGTGQTSLLKIVEYAGNNIGTEFQDLSDLRVYLGACVALCTLGCKDGITHNKMVVFSSILYNNCDTHNGTELEPYMFAFMFNWPGEDLHDTTESIPAHRLPEVVENWKKAFNRKYPRKQQEGRKETTFFFLANGKGMERYLYEGELPQKNYHYRTAEFWNSYFVSKKLMRLSGILLNQGNIVSVTLEQDGNKSHIEIPTSLPQTNVTMHNKLVSFYLGFSWSGPKAYNVFIDDPQFQSYEGACRIYDEGECSLSGRQTPPKSKPQMFYSTHRTYPPPISDHQLNNQFNNRLAELQKREKEIKKELKISTTAQKKSLSHDLRKIQDDIDRLVSRQKKDTDVFKFESN